MKRYVLFQEYQDERAKPIDGEEFDFRHQAISRAEELGKNSICYGTVHVHDRRILQRVYTAGRPEDDRFMHIHIDSTADKTPYDQEAKQLGVPVIPPIQAPHRPSDPNPVVAICGQCGMHICQLMHYVCSQPNCPAGLGGPSCQL
jgi:hypothetical protein